MLGYFTSVSPNYLEALVGDPAIKRYEGDKGGAHGFDILHPCSEQERPELTKYQALFDADAMFDRYRLAFFQNFQKA